MTNEDYAGMLCVFENGARGTFEAGRTLLGPESQMAFDLHGDAGALGWNLERMNELQVYLATDELHSGYTVSAASASPTTALRAGQRQRDRLRGPGRDRGLRVLPLGGCATPHRLGFEDALAGERAGRAASVRESGGWEDVVSLRED